MPSILYGKKVNITEVACPDYRENFYPEIDDIPIGPEYIYNSGTTEKSSTIKSAFGSTTTSNGLGLSGLNTTNTTMESSTTSIDSSGIKEDKIVDNSIPVCGVPWTMGIVFINGSYERMLYRPLWRDNHCDDFLNNIGMKNIWFISLPLDGAVLQGVKIGMSPLWKKA